MCLMLVQTHPGPVRCFSYLIKHMKAFTNTFCSVQITGSRSQKPPVSTLVGNPRRAAKAQTPPVHPRGRTQVWGQRRGQEPSAASYTCASPRPPCLVRAWRSGICPLTSAMCPKEEPEAPAPVAPKNCLASSHCCCPSFPLSFRSGLAPQKPVPWIIFPETDTNISNTYPEGIKLGLLNLHSMWLFKPPNLLDLVH